MEQKNYTKLSALVNDSFVITGSYGWKWKKWNPQTNKMELSDKWEQGFRKMWTLITDKGILDVSESQLGEILARACSSKTLESKLIGLQVGVKSNGKTGMEIRYFFNALGQTQEAIAVEDEESFNVEDINF